MSDKNYAEWMDLNNQAVEAMATVQLNRAAGDSVMWTVLAHRAIALQELATKFAKTVV